MKLLQTEKDLKDDNNGNMKTDYLIFSLAKAG